MIDERHEELAALYALDLLEGLEKEAFQTLLKHDPELRKLVDELRESSTAFAHSIPAATPPPELKARLLAEIGAPEKSRAPNKIIAFPSWIPWAAAACFAFALAWTGRLYFASRADAASAREQLALADISLKSTQQQLEAERIVVKQQLAGLNQQVTETARQLADARAASGNADRQFSSAAQQLAEANQKLADATRQIASLDERLNEAARIAGTTASRETELNRALASAQTQIATLEERMKNEGDLANLKIAQLASMLKNSPQAIAVAVWSPEKQEGIFTLEKMPAAAADQDYQLWVIDPQQPKPISAGVFEVGPDGAVRVRFKTETPVATAAKFAVSREKKGGAPAYGGPKGDVVLISQ